MTELSFDFKIICNDCKGSEIKEISKPLGLSDGGVMRKFECQECKNIVFVTLDVSSTRFTLEV